MVYKSKSFIKRSENKSMNKLLKQVQKNVAGNSF